MTPEILRGLRDFQALKTNTQAGSWLVGWSFQFFRVGWWCSQNCSRVRVLQCRGTMFYHSLGKSGENTMISSKLIIRLICMRLKWLKFCSGEYGIRQYERSHA